MAVIIKNYKKIYILWPINSTPENSSLKGGGPQKIFGGYRFVYYLDYRNGFMGVHIHVQTYQIIYIKCIQFFVYQLYLNKAVFYKKRIHSKERNV